MFKFFVPVVCALTLFTSACSSNYNADEVPDVAPESLYEVAQSAMASGDYTLARRYLEAIDSRYPFGELSEHDCGNCDVCNNPPQRFDGHVLAQKALSAIVRADQMITIRTTIDILRGNLSPEVVKNGYEQLKTFGVGHDVPAKDWRDYLLQMLQMGLFEIAYNENNHLKLTDSGRKVLYHSMPVVFARMEQKPADSVRSGKNGRGVRKPFAVKTPSEPVLTGRERQLYHVLHDLRRTLADKQGVPPYIIMSDKVLMALCEIMPTTIEAFGQVNGIGEYKKDKYGAAFVTVIKKFA